MKLLVVLMLVGCASATLFEAFERESRDVSNDFMTGMQSGTPLHTALGIEDSEEIRRFERDLKEQLKEHIKKAFEDVMKKINEAMDKGKKVNEKALQMLKDLHDRLQNHEITDSDLKETIEALKSKVESYLKNILEKMGILYKRSAQFEPLGDLSLRNIFLKLKEMIKDKMDTGSLKESISKYVGRGAQTLCEWLTNKGKEKVINFFDRLLDDDKKKKRATEDHLQEVKDYLKDLEKDMENKVSSFRQWLHDLIHKGLVGAEDKIKNAREIVKKIIAEGTEVSKKRLAELIDVLIREGSDFKSFYEDLRKIIREELKKTQ